jgi:hypothetical protein
MEACTLWKVSGVFRIGENTSTRLFEVDAKWVQCRTLKRLHEYTFWFRHICLAMTIAPTFDLFFPLLLCTYVERLNSTQD